MFQTSLKNTIFSRYFVMSQVDSAAAIYTPKNTFVSSFSSYLFDLVHIQPHNLVAASSSDDLIKIYDSSRFQFKHQFTGHSDAIMDLQYSNYHTNQLFSCSSDKTIRGWDFGSGSECFKLQCKQSNHSPFTITLT